MKLKNLILKQHPNFEYIKSLGPGESFGELNFDEKSRNGATVVCSKDTDFLVISREKYETIQCKFILMVFYVIRILLK